jgi:hypothetical protein
MARPVLSILEHCPTCLTSELICPTSVRKSRAFIHSAVLSLVSLARSCKCTTTRSRMNFNRGSGHVELIACTLLVMFSIVRSLRLIGADVGGIVICDVVCFVKYCREVEHTKKGRMRRALIQIYGCSTCIAMTLVRPNLHQLPQWLPGCPSGDGNRKTK